MTVDGRYLVQIKTSRMAAEKNNYDGWKQRKGKIATRNQSKQAFAQPDRPNIIYLRPRFHFDLVEPPGRGRPRSPLRRRSGNEKQISAVAISFMRLPLMTTFLMRHLSLHIILTCLLRILSPIAKALALSLHRDKYKAS